MTRPAALEAGGEMRRIEGRQVAGSMGHGAKSLKREVQGMPEEETGWGVRPQRAIHHQSLGT